MIGRRDYAERRAARIARLEARAASAAAERDQRHATVDRLTYIMNGQPILVGHHSEKRHRRDLQRMSDNMRKAYEAHKSAETLTRRAAAAEANPAISSDDPNALERLREKLARLESSRDGMKAANAAIRKYAKAGPDAQAAALAALGYHRDLLKPDFAGRIGFPAYELTNTGAEIRRLQGRIAELERRAAAPEREPVTVGDVTVDESENRVRIQFPGKPAATTIATLKQNGFRWSPRDGVWQRHSSEQAWRLALQIAGQP